MQRLVKIWHLQHDNPLRRLNIALRHDGHGAFRLDVGDKFVPVHMLSRHAYEHRALRRLPRILYNVGNERVSVPDDLRALDQSRQLPDFLSHAVSSRKFFNLYP